MRILVFILACLVFTSHIHAQSKAQPEDLQKLEVIRDQFSPASPMRGGVQTQPGFTRELLQMEWRNGDPIDIYIIRPAGVVKPRLVLFLYSWPDDTERFRSDEWCRNVTKHGFAAVGFVSALTGQRYHDRPWKEWFVSELPEALGKTVHDVQLLLDYLATRNDLDTTTAGIFGQGSGGTIALLAASVDLRLKAIDVIDPWGSWPEWLASSPLVPESLRAQYTTPAFLQKVAAFDPSHILPELTGRALRLEETSINPTTPITARLCLRRALPETATYITYVDEADYRDRAMDEGKILNWLQSRLIGL